MRYAPEHKALTRERVLKETVLAIRAGGLSSVGVVDVMKRAGLTHGGFYSHFASRDDLLVAALNEMFALAGREFDKRVADLGPGEALETYIRFYLSKRHRDTSDSGCPLPAISNEVPRLSPAVRERFAEAVLRLAGKLAGKLRQLGRDDADDLAASVLTEMVGALTISRAIGPTPQSDHLLANTRASVLKRLGLETRQ